MSQTPARGPLPHVPAGWGLATMVLAGVVTAIQTLLGITSFGAAEEYTAAARQGVNASQIVTTYDAVGVLYLGFAVAAYVVTCVWLDRARTLALALSGSSPTRSRVWVWLGWWVPVVNLWFPLQVVRDVRDGSSAPRTSVLGAWWACWIVMLVGSRVGSRLIPIDDVPDVDSVAALPWVEMVVTAASVMALVLWTQLIRDITDAQRRRLSPAAPRP